MSRLLPVLLCATLLTHLNGCVWLTNCADFERPQPLGISGPSLQGYVDENYESLGSGFLWYSTWTEPPHTLCFYSEEQTGDVAECVITDLSIRYADEETIHRPAELPAVAAYERQGQYADGREVGYRAEFKFPDLIEREESFTLEIEGYYQMRDGTRRPFKSEEHIDFERDRMVRPIYFMWCEV